MTAALLLINLLVIPLLLAGVVKKTKALMQTRIGSPILQPFYDVAKLLRKSETVSETASWVFVWSPRVALASAFLAAAIVPWTGSMLPEAWSPASNFLLVLYLLALSRFVTMLAALDTGSAFGGLGSSREATLSMLVEPTLVVGLAGLSLQSGSMDLQTMYRHASHPLIAVLVGLALLLASLAELSRMPIDDPTTHLELTMVHEAMILENSGPNLAMVEFAGALRMCLFFGLSAQSFLLAFRPTDGLLGYGLGLGAVFAVGIVVAIVEGVVVKLKWRSAPAFLAFGTALSFLAALIAVAK